MRQSKIISLADVSGFEGSFEDQKADTRTAYERLDRAYEYLLPNDRYVLEQYFVHGTSMTKIAGATRRCPKTIRRQLKRLVLRIHSMFFDYLILYGPAMEREKYKACDFVIFKGYSIVRASKKMGVSIRKVTKYLDELKEEVGV